MQNVVYDSPSIFVYYSKELENIEEFNEILWGMEEEGIPYKLKSVKNDDFTKLAYSASLSSKLRVGVGIDKNKNVALTFNKLSNDEYLFKANLHCDKEETLRKLGANSARLVKNMPFK